MLNTVREKKTSEVNTGDWARPEERAPAARRYVSHPRSRPRYRRPDVVRPPSNCRRRRNVPRRRRLLAIHRGQQTMKTRAIRPRRTRMAPAMRAPNAPPLRTRARRRSEDGTGRFTVPRSWVSRGPDRATRRRPTPTRTTRANPFAQPHRRRNNRESEKSRRSARPAVFRQDRRHRGGSRARRGGANERGSCLVMARSQEVDVAEHARRP